ncbi:PP2C family protein-serine/threonine phosphatase [Aeromicrobium panaciterrae]
MARYLDDRIVRWRTGSNEGQFLVLAALIGVTLGLTLISLVSYAAVPAATFIVPILLGMLALRFRPLLALVLFTVVCIGITVVKEISSSGLVVGRLGTLAAIAIIVAIVLFDSSRRRSGLPGPVGEAMLVDLRDRLQAQGVVPTLPTGWSAQSAMLTAGGVKFAGDFLVANLSDDETRLEMVLVDVCGKGVSAGTQSLQFAGALGGLIGALPPLGLFAAANDFLLRQDWDEGFATAVHVLINLESGDYAIINAGHPPALRWATEQRDWIVDGARGTALGITHAAEFHQTVGNLGVGDALMFYTDGVVESRTKDFTDGIQWLRGVAANVISTGFDQAAKRILAQVESGDDDRAVLIVSRALSVAGTGSSSLRPRRARR